MQRFSIAAWSTVVALLAPAPVATASSQTDLADWLSRAAPHVEAIHKAESDAYAVIAARGRIDDDKLKQSCGRLHDANEALREVMPTPNPNLTAEVQQAIDNFDSASESCTEYFNTDDDAKLNDFWSHSRTAEQHLSSADSILVGLTPSK
ncbi:hypothetical protein PT015_15915 [Candidatus Mycobacterium wuenschmannii]|uniref:Secreted protein n=1 Tax=Candidatus Mycobacterium wuenschmannii TaxID=3027808 RepID=A0ABY8VRX5_9MYCO|nr:hypothetical protein [Candidatus Mycobacterium wuenschmannii]WIM86388.1 hypothetical protein PT015_15915 [Candidatus Mycobacterium wuenschmannii]